MTINLNSVHVHSGAPKGRQSQSYSDALAAFRDAIASAGLGTPEILPDGTLHRFKTPEDKGGDRSGWYVLFMDNIPSGSFGSWRSGSGSSSWSARESYEMTPQEIECFRERARLAKELRDAERLREAEAAAEAARDSWATAQPATLNPYLKAKGVEAFNVRQQGEVLLIPMVNASGELRGLQRVYPEGKKRFTPGMEKKGCFHWIDGDRSIVIICEGYATGASLHMATGQAVVIAFDAGNLECVAKTVHEGMPQAALLIAADNDQWTKKPDGTPWNTGLEAARRAATAVGGTVIIPEFRDLSTKPTDFNDLHTLEGLKEVRMQAVQRFAGPSFAEWGIEAFFGASDPTAWLVRDTLPLGCPCLLAAAGGTGKGMLTLDLGLTVAGGSKGIDLSGAHDWLGASVDARGSVVILTAEDSKQSVHQRLDALDPDQYRRTQAKGRLFIVPLPNAGGPMQLVAADGKGGFVQTPALEQIRRQLRRIPDLKLINIDPLASFVGCDINKDPQAGQYVQGALAALAEETGACVLVAHHLSKPQGQNKGWDAEAARNAIRGTTALVDGVRCAVAIWPGQDASVSEVSKALGYDVPKGRVYESAVVKSNAPANTDVRTLVRSVSGLLVCHDGDIQRQRTELPIMLDLLEVTIAEAAAKGRPFTRTGTAGVFLRRDELPQDLRTFGCSRRKLDDMVQQLLDAGRVVGCTYKTSLAKYLDVPGGNFAEGCGFIESGGPNKTA